MRIALFTEHFLPKVDGVVTRLLHTVRHLVEFGHEVEVFAPAHGAGRPADESVLGARVHRISSVGSPLYPEKRVAWPGRAVGRALRRFRPDVVHVANPLFLGVGGLLFGRSLKAPVVASLHTHYPKYLEYYGMGYLKGPAWRLIRAVFNRAGLVLCTSSAMQTELQAQRIPDAGVWQRGVDTDGLRPELACAEMRMRLSGGRPEAPLLLYVGRLAAEKDVHLLRPVLDALPEVRLALVGDGPARAQLEEVFAGSAAHFAGYLSGDALGNAYASCDALVLPSRTETLGLVLLEAMASGKPVIGPRAGGIPEIVSHGQCGYLFDPDGDCSELISLVGQLFEDGSRRRAMGQLAREEAERWSWEAATRQLETFYRSLLTQEPGIRPQS